MLNLQILHTNTKNTERELDVQVTSTFAETSIGELPIIWFCVRHWICWIARIGLRSTNDCIYCTIRFPVIQVSTVHVRMIGE